jgi:phosphoglycolate phosphatase
MDADAFGRQLEQFGMAGMFEATYAGVTDKREMIRRILEQHRLNPAETAFVGDMIHDVETARHGGVASVAVLTGYTHPEALATARPDLTVPDLAGLRALMERGTPGGGAAVAGWRDRIHVRGLRVATRLGVPDAERAVPQEVAVDLVLEPLTGFDEVGDRLAATVDYQAVTQRVCQVGAERPRQLVETLAVEIARELLANWPLAAVEVTIDKFILPNTRSVGVTVRREAAAKGG